MKIYLNASDISSYINQNPFDNITGFERLWKKCKGENDIESIKQKFLKKAEGEIDEESQKEEIIKKVDLIIKESDQRLKEKVDENFMKSLDCESTSIQEKLKFIKKSDSGDEIKKQATSYISKRHGIKYENNAIKKYEEQYGVKLDTSQEYYCKMFYKDKDKYQDNDIQDEWYIGGKMDGICDEYIVEVKNRTKGFFSILRDYEKTQMYIYMILADKQTIKLVESYKDKIKVTEINKDIDYEKYIMKQLVKFIKQFILFIGNEEEKEKYLFMDNDMKKEYIKRMVECN